MNSITRRRQGLYSFLVLLTFLFALKMFNTMDSSSYTIHTISSSVATKFTYITRKTQVEASNEWGDIVREQRVAITCNCTSLPYNGIKALNGSFTKRNAIKTVCMRKQFPKAILVGMTKGGTTALMNFLEAHPMIAPRSERPKDTRYFNHYYEKPYDWYRNLMPCSFPHQITISKSTEYFFTSGVAERIRKFDPLMKIVIMIREPIARTLSQYVMWKYQAGFRIGNTSFEDAVTTGSNKDIDKESRLIIVSNYQRHMKAWIDNFGLNRILIIDGLNFVKKPAEELNKLEDFLGVDRYFTEDKFVYNATKRKYCLSSKDGNIDCLEDKKGLPHPVIENNLKIKLEDFFRPRNKMFFEMINRTFDWGY